MKSIYIIGLLLSASLSISAQTSRNADYEGISNYTRTLR